MDELLTWNNTEEMDQVFSCVADVAADSVAAGGRVEDGEVDVGVGVSGVEEAAEGDGIRGFPEFEDAVDVDEVVEEAAVFVPAFAGADGLEDGD